MPTKLRYDMDKLEPYISKETIEYHYTKHHSTYADKLNKDIAGTKYESMELEEIIKQSDGPIYNNAAQLWNHNFYFNCLSPDGGGEPEGELFVKIEETYEDFYHFKEVFTTQALTNFGSGWTWLALDSNKKLIIINTSNADNLLKTEYKALMVIDIWEHAYYLDYKNDRKKYIENFWNIVDWKNIKL